MIVVKNIDFRQLSKKQTRNFVWSLQVKFKVFGCRVCKVNPIRKAAELLNFVNRKYCVIWCFLREIWIQFNPWASVGLAALPNSRISVTKFHTTVIISNSINNNTKPCLFRRLIRVTIPLGL